MIALIIAVIAVVLAIFAFVDRKALEADVAALKKKVTAVETLADTKLRNAVNAVKTDFGGRVQTLEARATALEKKAEAKVQATVNKAKAGIKVAVASAKKRL